MQILGGGNSILCVAPAAGKLFPAARFRSRIAAVHGWCGHYSSKCGGQNKVDTKNDAVVWWWLKRGDVFRAGGSKGVGCTCHGHGIEGGKVPLLHGSLRLVCATPWCKLHPCFRYSHWCSCRPGNCLVFEFVSFFESHMNCDLKRLNGEVAMPGAAASYEEGCVCRLC